MGRVLSSSGSSSPASSSGEKGFLKVGFEEAEARSGVADEGSRGFESVIMLS